MSCVRYLAALALCFAPLIAAARSQSPAANKDVNSSGEIKTHAVQIEGGISDRDYPLEAIRNSEAGTVVVQFVIAANGRVPTCEITQSSGSEVLDKTSCEIVRTRFQFKPARNRSGKVVQETRSQKIAWRLPTGLALVDPQLLAPYSADLAKVSTLMHQPSEASRIEGLSILNRLVEKVPRPSMVAGIMDGLKGEALFFLGRFPAARAAYLSSVEQYQGDPQAIRTLLGLQLDNNDPAGALKTLKIAQANHPAIVRALEIRWKDILFREIRDLPKDQRQDATDEMCIILVDGGWQQKPRTDYGDMVLECAIQAHLRRSEVDGARALLEQQPTTDTLVRLSVDKRFQAIWPELDRFGTDGFRGSIARDVLRAAEASKAMPNDFKAATRLIQALRLAGRSGEAAEAGSTLASKTDRIEAAGDAGFWMVNEYAYALEESGQTDEALARMGALIGLGMERYPDLVSQAINRAEMLNKAGMYEKAISAFDEVEKTQAVSSYGKMWIWAGRACALRELNREADAKADEKKLGVNPKDNEAAATMAAACRGDQASVESLLVSRLESEEDREYTLASMVHYAHQTARSRFEGKLQRTMDAARNSPRVRAKLATYGRLVEVAGSRGYWGDF